MQPRICARVKECSHGSVLGTRKQPWICARVELFTSTSISARVKKVFSSTFVCSSLLKLFD